MKILNLILALLITAFVSEASVRQKSARQIIEGDSDDEAEEDSIHDFDRIVRQQAALERKFTAVDDKKISAENDLDYKKTKNVVGQFMKLLRIIEPLKNVVTKQKTQYAQEWWQAVIGATAVDSVSRAVWEANRTSRSSPTSIATIYAQLAADFNGQLSLGTSKSDDKQTLPILSSKLFTTVEGRDLKDELKHADGLFAFLLFPAEGFDEKALPESISAISAATLRSFVPEYNREMVFQPELLKFDGRNMIAVYADASLLQQDEGESEVNEEKASQTASEDKTTASDSPKIETPELSIGESTTPLDDSKTQKSKATEETKKSGAEEKTPLGEFLDPASKSATVEKAGEEGSPGNPFSIKDVKAPLTKKLSKSRSLGRSLINPDASSLAVEETKEELQERQLLSHLRSITKVLGQINQEHRDALILSPLSEAEEKQEECKKLSSGSSPLLDLKKELKKMLWFTDGDGNDEKTVLQQSLRPFSFDESLASTLLKTFNSKGGLPLTQVNVLAEVVKILGLDKHWKVVPAKRTNGGFGVILEEALKEAKKTLDRKSVLFLAWPRKDIKEGEDFKGGVMAFSCNTVRFVRMGICTTEAFIYEAYGGPEYPHTSVPFFQGNTHPQPTITTPPTTTPLEQQTITDVKEEGGDEGSDKKSQEPKGEQKDDPLLTEPGLKDIDDNNNNIDGDDARSNTTKKVEELQKKDSGEEPLQATEETDKKVESTEFTPPTPSTIKTDGPVDEKKTEITQPSNQDTDRAGQIVGGLLIALSAIFVGLLAAVFLIAKKKQQQLLSY